MQKLWKFSTSFQLGIPVMVAITVLMIWGTIVESMYDAFAAQKIVYSSWMMYVSMGLLCFNLAAVMVDRWPWKQRHTPFLLVHIGIITLILGGWITQKFGIDGSMPIPLNGKNNYVSVGATDLVIYATFNGDRYTKFFEKEVDFFSHPPSQEKPFEISLGDKSFKIVDYYKYARVSKKLKVSDDENAGASVKIQLQNMNVKQVETLTQLSKNKEVDVNLGPLKINLGYDLSTKNRKNKSSNEIYLNAVNADTVKVTLFRKEEVSPFLIKNIKIGDVVQTGWMGLEFRLLDYLPKAVDEWEAIQVERPTPLTSAAIKVVYGDKTQWVLLNDIVKLFGEQAAYLVSYQNRRLDLGFPVQLVEFKKTNYQGTMKAKAYSSQVKMVDPKTSQTVEGLIAMNEPVKMSGYTFYQSSFTEDEKTGEPTASVLNVNYDPGRAVKYWGSLILSLGIVWLFVQTRKRKTAESVS